MKFSVPFFLLMLLFALASCSKSPEPPRVQEVLGTLCSVNAFADGTAALYDSLFARLQQIDDIFSANKAESELSAVNRVAGERAVPVSAELFSVLQTALSVAELTGGAFDPTIAPLVTAWGINTPHAHVPSPKEINGAKSLVNYHYCVLSEKDTSVFLAQKSMALDLGGIAKGYAADELIRILRAHHVKRAVIDLGGNIYVFGEKSDGTPWNVGVKNPQAPLADPALALAVSENSVVTSGVYERFFEQDGIRYHHILDAQTGYPAATGVLSVTVVHQSSMLADAFSTALFVLGQEKGLSFAEQLGISAVFIDENQNVTATSDLAQNVILF